MDELDDLPLDPDPQPPVPEADPKPVWPWVAALVIVAAAAAVLVYLQQKPDLPKPNHVTEQAATATRATPAAQSTPMGPAVAPVELPPLDASDAAVRELVRAVSGHPSVLAWLATDGLVRNLAVCLDNVADGKSPSRHLRALAPTDPFRATGSRDRYTADPASFARYDRLSAAVSGMDMAGVARLYVTLRPRLDEAFQDLGHKPGDADTVVSQALAHLLETPEVGADAPLVRVVLSYRFADERLETLSGAQKQLARMGPRNAGVVRLKLQELAAALR